MVTRLLLTLAAACLLSACIFAPTEHGPEAGTDADTGADAATDSEGSPRCGDGVLDVHEDCDGTDFGGATCADHGFHGGELRCSASCRITVEDCTEPPPECGDGTIDEHEQCEGHDTGHETCETQGFYDGHLACSAACQFDTSGCVGWCGDGILNGDEVCDDGINDGSYGGCAPNCLTKSPKCGDGNIDHDHDEACDDGVENGTYGFCKADCSGFGPRCGDGVVSDGETCDDGNLNGNYGQCGADCRSAAAHCGDGNIDPNHGEVCDDGANNGRYGFCKLDCSGLGLHCGDGQTSHGEVCDDGQDNGGYGFCKLDCSGLGRHCGDGQRTDSEVCDDGANNGKYGFCGDDCLTMGPRCGDGVVNGPEQCDEGDDNNGSPPSNCTEACTTLLAPGN